jgi:phosphoglycolate phosphatase/putative hydrolase of the HAD superfamily
VESYDIPDHVDVVCFDIDKTLYTDDSYADTQIRVLVERLAEHLHITVAEAEQHVEETRREIRTHSHEASLGNVFVSLGISMEQSVAWRLELIRPGDYLQSDPDLRDALVGLSGRGFVLAALTNNPVGTGRATLKTLGVGDLFDVVGGLDSTLRSKPDRAPFRWMLDRLAVPAGRAVFVGDRYGVDIAPARELGAGGILVSGVEEVYGIADALPKTAGGGQ